MYKSCNQTYESFNFLDQLIKTKPLAEAGSEFTDSYDGVHYTYVITSASIVIMMAIVDINIVIMVSIVIIIFVTVSFFVIIVVGTCANAC
jgi:uncharacterized membrane protein